MSIKGQLGLVDASDVAAGTDQVDGAASADPGKMRDLVAELRGTKNAGTSLNVKIQDSFDGGATWNDWITFTQLTADGAEVKAPARPPGGDIRAIRTSVGDGWDYRVKVSGNPLA